MEIILWIGINALIGYAIGKQKNEVAGAIIISILLGPIGWIIALLSRGKLRKCPFCAESVKPEAKVCRYCGRELPANAVAAVSDRRPLPLNPTARRNIVISLSIVAMVILATLIIGPEKRAQKPSEETIHLTVARYSPMPAASSETPQQSYYWSLRLTKPVELKDTVGRVTARLQEGQSVQYVGRDNYVARIRYDGIDYEIPISSTDLK